MSKQNKNKNKLSHLFEFGSNIYTWGEQNSNISAAENYLSNNSQKPVIQTQQSPKVQNDIFGNPKDNVLGQQSNNSDSGGSGNGAPIGQAMSTVSGVIGFAKGIKDTFGDMNQKADIYEGQVNNNQIENLSNINDFDSLEDYANSIQSMNKVNVDDLTGDLKSRLGRYGSTSMQAAQAGNNFGPWGLLIGSIIGQVGAGLSDTLSRKKAKNRVNEINDKIDFIDSQNRNMIANKAENIANTQFANRQWDYIAALGGNLHSNSTTWSNGLNYIGSGGSHESNPNDGVAISTAPDGLQNKVEEGEVVWNDDYVFSKRLKVPKKDLEKNKWKGETYADIAKKLMDESAERPNDPITLRGLDDSLSRLRDSQEELKAKQEGNKIKKEIASMPPELLAQMQQAQQQPSEEEIMQQQAMEQMPQEQIPMVDPSMQQPMMEQPPMYAKGGHLLSEAGSIKAMPYTGFDPVYRKPITVAGISKDGLTIKIETPEEYTKKAIKARFSKENEANLLRNMNSQKDYVNLRNAYGHNRGPLYNTDNYRKDFSDTPFNSKNIAYGTGNQFAYESGTYRPFALPVQDFHGIKSIAGDYRNLGSDQAYMYNPLDKKSSNFFESTDPNVLKGDSLENIYFFNNDINDMTDVNKTRKSSSMSLADKEKQYIDNVSSKSGIYFNPFNKLSKGGHLHALGDPIRTVESGYYKDNTELLKDPYRGYSMADLQRMLPNYPQVQDEIDRRLAFLDKQKQQNALQNFINPEINASRIQNAENYLNRDNDIIAKAEYAKAIDSHIFRKTLSELIDNSEPKTKTKEAKKEKEAREHRLKLNAFDWDGTTLRYAPVWGSIFNLARSIADRPDYGNPERIERVAARAGTQVSPKYIGDYLRYRPLDESYYLNQLNAQQNAANNAIVGLSNGNRSMALASMLANDYNYNNQRGAAYRQGLEYNEAQRQRAAEFNRGTNQFNAQQYMQAAAQNASNRAQAANLISAAAQMREGIDNAYGASQSANWTSLFNNIGNVGKDEMNRKMTDNLYDYFIDRTGKTSFKGTNAKRGGYLTIKTNNRRKE